MSVSTQIPTNMSHLIRLEIFKTSSYTSSNSLSKSPLFLAYKEAYPNLTLKPRGFIFLNHYFINN